VPGEPLNIPGHRVPASAPGNDPLRGAQAVPCTQQSLLFPELIKRIDPGRRLTVFEIGSALPETVEYFSQFRCRLHFASMFADPLLERQPGDLGDEELVAALSDALGIPASTRFDLCLFWDFPNYLEDRVLRAFDKALRPFVRRGARGHAFALRTLDTGLLNQRYGVDQSHMLRIRPRHGPPMRCYPKTQATLVNLMPGFDVNQGMLLPDGRLEVIMTASGDEA